jgi:hypothetical protein
MPFAGSHYNSAIPSSATTADSSTAVASTDKTPGFGNGVGSDTSLVVETNCKSTGILQCSQSTVLPVAYVSNVSPIMSWQVNAVLGG